MYDGGTTIRRLSTPGGDEMSIKDQDLTQRGSIGVLIEEVREV